MKQTTMETNVEDVYGQVHPVETPELIASKRDEFDAEILALPTWQKLYIHRAQELCPELFTDDLKLLFLRSEVFCAKVRTLGVHWSSLSSASLDGSSTASLTLEEILSSIPG
jgi:hypothetical protein